MRRSYARVKTQMILRTSDDHPGGAARRPSRLRLLTACAVVAGLVLGTLAGGSGAGISNYTGTLYFAGGASSVSGSYLLTTAAPAAQGATPVATAGLANSGGVPTGAYKYVYVTSSGGALTASVASNQVSVTNAPVTLTNVPLGADVYRAKIPASTNTSQYILVSPSGGAAAVPYVDTSTATTGQLLPQADTRVATGSTGWYPFTAGVSLVNSFSNSSAAAGSPPTIPSTCVGWTVDASGSMSFAAGTWTFTTRVKPDASANGVATVTAAMWKVDNSGATVSGGTIVPPTDSGALTLNGNSQTASVSFTTSAAATLDSNEHLCVQFWRHQTTAYTSGAATNHTIALLAYDPINRITVHPAPNAFASAALSSPAGGASSTTIPTLSATYSDSEADAGTLTLRLCSDAGCGTVLQTSSALAATNGQTLSWTPAGPLADNTYYWQARAQDGAGLPSPWTASRSFTIDNVAPTTSITSSPASPSNASGGSFAFSANESVTGYQCKLDAGSYAACSSPAPYSGLPDGAHTFSVKAVADLAGNAGTATSFGWTIDTVAPNTSLTSTPPSLSNSTAPSFAMSATEPGSTFECSLDAAAYASCSSPKAYSGVADGPHTFSARAIDTAGNIDPTPSSYAWTVDATPPDTTIGPSEPAPLTTATSATFDVTATEPGSTLECKLDGGAFVACVSPKSYSGLADGSHTFQARGIDAAGNTDPSPASYGWTVDTTPPDTTIGPTEPPADSASTSATFDVASTEPGSSFTCRLDAGAYSACTSPVSYSALTDGSHTFAVKATDPAGNTDLTSASYSWEVDTVAPGTPGAVAPADGLLTTAAPALSASFSDGTPGDSGTVEFRLCQVSAPAGTACAPVVQAATSGTVSNGGTATVSPAALADGTYHWQTRAQDAAGNLSGWSATRSFRIDSVKPDLPAIVTPADGAWAPRVLLRAVFSKPSFVGLGYLSFRLCSDALCLSVVASGNSGDLPNGTTGEWSPSGRVGDGLLYWQVRAQDAAGNQSAWSPARVLNLDATPPARPPNVNGHVQADGLVIRWDPPVDTIGNFVVYVNGAPWKTLGDRTYELNVGPFDATDTRSFGIVAIDRAGNASPMSQVLVGVPNLVGLTVGQAEAATHARGLVLRRDPSLRKRAGTSLIVSQDPEPGSLAAKGSAIKVVVAGSPEPLTLQVAPARVVCGDGGTIRLRLSLSEAARVRVTLFSPSGKRLLNRSYGVRPPGTSTLTIRMPRGGARLVFDAAAGSRTARTVVRIATGSSRACRGR